MIAARLQVFFLFCAALLVSASSFNATAQPPAGQAFVDEHVSLDFGPLRYDRALRVFYTDVAVQNTAAFPIFGPVNMVLEDVNPLAPLVDGAGQVLAPAVQALATPNGFLAPSEIVQTRLNFKLRSRRTRVSFVPRTTGRTFSLSGLGAAPSALPLALDTNGSPLSSPATVVLSVRLTVADPLSSVAVELERTDTSGGSSVAMNDAGVGGDAVAGDGVFSATLQLDALEQANTGAGGGVGCFGFQAFSNVNGASASTSELLVCVTQFEPTFAQNTRSEQSNLLELSDSTGQFAGATVVADELLIEVVPDALEADIEALAASVGMAVVGTQVRERIYQLRYVAPLPFPLDESALLGTLATLLSNGLVSDAYPNPVLFATARIPNDPSFTSSAFQAANGGPQRGLERIGAPDVWDISRGSGVEIYVLDSGLDFKHEDMDDTEIVADTVTANLTTCGLPGGCNATTLGVPADGTADDFDDRGHGTNVASIIGARGENNVGMAGVAYESALRVQMLFNSINNITYTKLRDALNAVAGLSNKPDVLNLSVSGRWTIASWQTQVCSGIANIADSGVLVVIAAGNTDTPGGGDTKGWPAGCRTHSAVTSAPGDLQKLVITVAGSEVFEVSSGVFQDRLCGSVSGRASSDPGGVCQTTGSLTGSHIDVVAPGVDVLAAQACAVDGDCDSTSRNAGDYERVTGTSFAAPIVSGAAALLLSKGVPKENIQDLLRNNASEVLTPDGSGLETSLCASGTTAFSTANCAGRIDLLATFQSLNALPSFGGGAGPFAVTENTANGVVIGSVAAAATDADAVPGELVFSLASGGNGLINVQSDGQLTVGGLIDREARSKVDLVVEVEDALGASATLPVSVTVNGINDNAPTYTGPTALNVPENTPVGTASAQATLSATDADLPPQALSFAITGGADQGRFEIVSGNRLRLNFVPDFETPLDSNTDNDYEVQITVREGGVVALGTPQNITFTVTDVVEATPLPDLIITAVTMTQYTPDRVVYDVTVQNVGTATADLDGSNPSFEDDVAVQGFLSGNQIFGDGDDFAAGGTRLLPVNSLAPGASFTITRTVGPPVGGPDFPNLANLVVKIDFLDDLAESNELNNTLSTPTIPFVP